jgi:AraC-like DNA-binding protein
MNMYWTKEFQNNILKHWNPTVDNVIHRVADEEWSLKDINYLLHAFCFIVKGKGCFSIYKNEKLRQEYVTSGDIIYFEPGDRLSIKTEDGIEYYTIHFNVDNIDKLGKIDSNNDFMNMKVVKNQLFLKLFMDLWNVWSSKLYGYQWKARVYLMQIIDMLLEEIRALNPSKQLIVDELIKYMVENKKNELNFEDLSHTMKVSQAYLIRVFKSVTGVTPIRYFNNLKMDEAKAMLLFTNMMVKDIAEELGFKDEFYFSRLFKKLTGIAPTFYRLRNGNGDKFIYN